MEKFTDRTERFAVQSMVTPDEKNNYKDKLEELNRVRRNKGLIEITSADIFRHCAIKFTQDPAKMLNFINFK